MILILRLPSIPFVEISQEATNYKYLNFLPACPLRTMHLGSSFSLSSTRTAYFRARCRRTPPPLPAFSGSHHAPQQTPYIFTSALNPTPTYTTTTILTRSYSSTTKPSSTIPSAAASEADHFDWRKMAELNREHLKKDHKKVFEHNRAWAAHQTTQDPDFFTKLSAGQSPEYLWIGCSDSRIPAEQITGMSPGEAFVHRNIANLVCNTDLNVMSVINYAVRHLQVKHIVICGHYGCGGVKAAMTPKDMGLLNPWLRNIRDVYRLHEEELDGIPDGPERYDRLVELNVVEQCRNIVKTAAIQQSYARNGFPIVHGWVFGFNDGLLKDLEVDFESMLRKVQKIYDLSESHEH
ncbi:carbonic anhydrase [Pseudomassariella vexata]|uniref:Carbonic anhydrase n=1 Tax=Pseudomassariella vexata TaxID=1141098 RepID=A0A1Y2ELA4_9PEZI|nr:carbonic anhydrase [Pseudomassariella vexata]ORY72074.1 carbonic anhydrase [Pseudomassariella vexata]